MTPHQLPTSAKPYSRLVAWGPMIAVALLLTIMWGMLLGFAIVQEQRMVEGAQKQLRLINNAAAQQTRDLLRSLDGRIEVVQQWLALAPQPDGRLDDLLQSFARHSQGLVEVTLVNQVGTAMPTAGTPAWARTMPAVTLPETAGSLHVGAPLRRTAGEAWRWPLSRRLPAPVGDIVGVVAWVDLAKMSAIHERLREKPAGGISVTTSSGIVVLRTPYADNVIARNVSSLRPRALPASASQGAFEHDGSLTGGKLRLGTYERLDQFPVTVLVSQERDELLGAFQARRDAGIGVMVVLTLCGIVFSWLLARSQR
ncbi:MAG: hypothetical protein ABW190_15070, partial [Rhizobacter sp.]